MELAGIIVPIIIFILYGFWVLIKKRFMVSSVVSNFINMLITLTPFVTLVDYLKPIGVILIYSSFILLTFLLQKGSYIIYGVNRELVTDILTNFLKEKKISYEEKNNSIKLVKYDKSIDYTNSFDCVSVNLRDIRKLPIFEEIKSKLRLEIEDIELKLFPVMASINIVGGIGLLIFIAIVNLKLSS